LAPGEATNPGGQQIGELAEERTVLIRHVVADGDPGPDLHLITDADPLLDRPLAGVER
jgi:hypothetical protein